MATGITREMFSPEYQKYKSLQTLVERFNKGDLDYLPTKEKEQIAMLAAQHGMDFNVKSKPVRKGLFDLVDTALFGLVPNKWRPKSVGEDYFGESRADRLAGTLGTIAGFGTGVAGVTKLAGKAAAGLGTAGWQGAVGRGAAKVSDYGSRGIDAAKRGGKSLWDMTTEGGNALRSRVLNNQYYKGAVNKGSESKDKFYDWAANDPNLKSMFERYSKFRENL